VGLALKGASGFMGPALGVAPEMHDRDRVQGPVQRPVSAGVEAVSGGGRCWPPAARLRPAKRVPLRF
jgi:hypothetical protein